MTSTVNGIVFGLLALATVGGALGVVGSKNVMHAAYWLLEVSLAAVGIYFLLEADYVALVQLLVYAGAVAVLVIFTVMISLRRREDAVRSLDFSWTALIGAVLFFAALAFVLVGWEPASAQMPQSAPGILDIGRHLFSPDGWALPFEIASLILTAALVAAVWWAREGDE